MHGVPTEEFNLMHKEDEKTHEDFKKANGMELLKTITKITPLLRKNEDPNNYQTKLHQSIVIFITTQKIVTVQQHTVSISRVIMRYAVRNALDGFLRRKK
jgi:hypothetical protein